MNIPLKGQNYKDEFELVEDCKKGFRMAQNALYYRYAESFMILCLRYVSSNEEAREILMDTFINAYKNISKFQYMGEGSLLAWLKRLAINQCLMHLRKKNIRFLELKDGGDHDAVISDDIVSQLSAREIMILIHNLPPGYRTVFNLYVFEEMSHKEIAQLLEITESTSKTQLYKARLLLQKQIRQIQ